MTSMLNNNTKLT